jgi:GT2 family glycosyltransferase
VKATIGPTIWERWLRDALKWDETTATGYVPPKATVVVCTRDRTDDLRRCLDALLRLPDDGQEYLVIDNCPATDGTRQLVSHYGDRVRYVREDRPGSSAARNRGLREARHEIVAFTDDDAVPDPDWLRALVRNFSDPLVLCVTGLVMPLELETAAQQWFERYSPFGRGFARIVFDCATHDPLNAAPVGVSASVAFRRSVIDYVGLFDDTLGPGTRARAGEDYELFSRILTSGYRIVYEPAALSWHRHRRTWKELRRTIYGYGVSVYALWTRALVVEGEFAVVHRAWGWFRYKQFPNLIRSVLRRSTRIPLDLLVVELCGCAVGPWAYFSSRRHARSLSRS